MDYWPFFWFILGLLLIIKGSDWFVEGAVWIARALKVSDIMIGATLVSLCTTLPEAMVSTNSALKGNTDMAMGNVLGSIAFNSGVVLAIILIFTQPKIRYAKNLKKNSKELLFLIGAVFLLGLVFGEIHRFAGILLLIYLGVYLLRNVVEARRIQREERLERETGEPEKAKKVKPGKKEVLHSVLIFTLGLGMTVLGAELLVNNGEIIAQRLGVPDLIIGLTMTSVGTSLPELVTAISAIRKKAQDLSVGNIMGANILNIILVIGIMATIEPVTMNLSILSFHLPFALFITVTIMIFVHSRKKQLTKNMGRSLLGFYGIYLAGILLTTL
ncbi:calcium/sodium antiporter [Isachenkonia alkalipeptolytica]|uniref:Calcium/sodium antiporter n=1 Tax=Isachenkonia alkalipeptolytica TaxID=2565777 RepID=A0AA43XNS5_9CLOT|nr:calcium/sodium antiporter [Isachenkonia alkalipeptolytica]NBG89674.1 calcium/sodium antiporter [Isachenkonia alkalipeptolytica]